MHWIGIELIGFEGKKGRDFRQLAKLAENKTREETNKKGAKEATNKTRGKRRNKTRRQLKETDQNF